MATMRLTAPLTTIALLMAVASLVGGQHGAYRKPWPTYSLQNMPKTQFTCHDKILGGYYADAETQCQMFHVCVKVAGVGVQDFRFLCPNGTAFDQEAQICADWGDVDCEQSVLYYGSDNFDLYRLGSGFESKRAPAAEEEEATFHLQRAESADIRRSKETRVDQKVSPDQPPNYNRHYGTTSRSSHAQTGGTQQVAAPVRRNEGTKKPIANFYTPTLSTSTSTSTTSNPERYTDESKQDLDDIFKGSHSSHFFANRNGGREDDPYEHQHHQRPKSNDYTTYNSNSNNNSNSNKKTETSTVGKARVSPTRSKRPLSTTKAHTTLATQKTTKKTSLKNSFSFDSFEYNQSSTTSRVPSTSKRPSDIGIHRFSAVTTKRPDSRYALYNTQEKIQPTTYNPGNNLYRLTSTTPKYPEFSRTSASAAVKTAYGQFGESKHLDKPNAYEKPTIAARKGHKGTQDSAVVDNYELKEFARVKTAQPKPFQQVPTSPATAVEPQYFRSRSQQVQVPLTKLTNQEPAPFSKPQQAQISTRFSGATPTTTEKSADSSLAPSKVFNSRGSINYKATTQRNSEFNGVTATVAKKFSTLVPKELYSPTTFKPTTGYKKTFDNTLYSSQQQQQQQPTVRPASKHPKIASTTLQIPPSTASPYYNPDEDDGQYHPELYELNFPKSRLNLLRSTTITPTSAATPKPTASKRPAGSTPIPTITTKRPIANDYNIHSPQVHLKTQQQSALQKQSDHYDLSDEEELFKTAHSLNFGAASINKLRADIIKAEKTSQQYNSQYSPYNQETSTTLMATYPTATTRFGQAYSKLSTLPPTTIRTTVMTTTTVKPHFEHFTSINSAVTTTTRRPAVTSTTQLTAKTSKSTGKPFKSGKNKKASSSKHSSKRPPHADEDTSYDYAYYDSDTLSESPQEYPEYEIAEFVKTRKN